MKLFIFISFVGLLISGCSESFPENCSENGYSGVVLVKNDPDMHGDCSDGRLSKKFGSEAYRTEHGSRRTVNHIYYTNEEYELLLSKKH